MSLKRERKKIAILYVCKNDNYTENFLARAAFVINYNAFLIKKLGLDKEFIIYVVDWCSEELVSATINLSPAARKITRFIEIEKSQLGEDNNLSATELHVTVAINAGLRRVSADYTLISGIDQLLTELSVLQIWELFAKGNGSESIKNAYCLIPRRFLSLDISQYTNNYNLVSRYFETINSSTFNFVAQKINVGAGVGGLIMKTDSYIKVGGFKEDWGGYGSNDTEFFARVSSKMGHRDLTNHGITLFKLPRTVGGSRLKRVNSQKLPNDYFNTLIFADLKNWGLQGVGLRKSSLSGASTQIENRNNLDERDLCSIRGYNLRLRLNELAKIFVTNRIYIPIAVKDSLQKPFSKNVVNRLQGLIKILRHTNVRTIWITESESRALLPYLTFLFPDISIVVLARYKTALNFCYETQINTIIRSLEFTGYYGNAKVIAYIAGQAPSLAVLKENNIFGILFVGSPQDPIAEDVLFQKQAHKLVDFVYFTRMQGKFRQFPEFANFVSVGDGWRVSSIHENKFENYQFLTERLEGGHKYFFPLLRLIDFLKVLDPIMIFLHRLYKRI